VFRTHLAVITEVSDGGRTVSVHHEIELVKASLLSADIVEVLSLGHQNGRRGEQVRLREANNMRTLLGSLDDDTCAT
jgi:hypothetical protein